jgi:hypothetical protein
MLVETRFARWLTLRTPYGGESLGLSINEERRWRYLARLPEPLPYRPAGVASFISLLRITDSQADRQGITVQMEDLPIDLWPKGHNQR